MVDVVGVKVVVALDIDGVVAMGDVAGHMVGTAEDMDLDNSLVVSIQEDFSDDYKTVATCLDEIKKLVHT
jgi:hypothetical protein